MVQLPVSPRRFGRLHVGFKFQNNPLHTFFGFEKSVSRPSGSKIIVLPLSGSKKEFCRFMPLEIRKCLLRALLGLKVMFRSFSQSTKKKFIVRHSSTALCCQVLCVESEHTRSLTLVILLCQGGEACSDDGLMHPWLSVWMFCWTSCNLWCVLN